jgi:hypothetical protein
MANVRRVWLVAAMLTLANPVLHKSISDVCDWVRARWGFESYNVTALIAIPVASLLVVLPALIRRRAVLLRTPTLVNVLIVSGISFAAQHWLLVANVELIHLPQFALLATLLLAAGLDASSAYLLSTAAGVLDETYQHLVIYAGVAGTYFDINDIVLNAIGAAWGVVLFAGMFEARMKTALSWRTGVAVAAVALPVLWWLDPPRFSPFLSPTTSGRITYRVMSSAEGLVACALLWGMTRFVTRPEIAGSRTEIAGPPARPAWT